ncbi:PLDc N-terminal domain-containing protein [Flavobacterium sp. SM2513]|uniref:PLDc N-terminal domain-containing protein n=1 Tax=Flavobacterium sp. SM2513 TaxID=3424766 RepID=UPI003D7F2E6C
MKLDLFKTSFLLSVLFIIVGTGLRITHVLDATTVLTIGLILTLTYIISGIIEVYQSSRSSSNKLMWALGFVIFNFFTAVFWLINRGKAIG